jgi:hypothetical protein
LSVTTIFPHVDVTTLALAGGGTLLLVLLGYGLTWARSVRGAEAVRMIESAPEVPREQWTMPPATLLSRPQWSTGRQAAMLALGSYMVVALALLIVKSVQLAGG